MDTDESNLETESIEGNVMCDALLAFLKKQPELDQDGRREWTGQATQLLELLSADIPDPAEAGWPTKAQILSQRLRKADTALAQAGVSVERKRNGNARSLIIVWTPGAPVRGDAATTDDDSQAG